MFQDLSRVVNLLLKLDCFCLGFSDFLRVFGNQNCELIGYICAKATKWIYSRQSLFFTPPIVNPTQNLPSSWKQAELWSNLTDISLMI